MEKTEQQESFSKESTCNMSYADGSTTPAISKPKAS